MEAAREEGGLRRAVGEAALLYQQAAAERHGEGQGGELLGEEAPQTGVVLVAEHLLRRNVLEMKKQKFPRTDVGI